MRSCLWLGLAWLLQAPAPGAAGTTSGLRRPCNHGHLEGDVCWRRLLFSTHFFLRVDPSGLVQGTIEIRFICMGIEELKVAHISFFEAINHRVHLYGCMVGVDVVGSGQALAGNGALAATSDARPLQWVYTAHGGFQERTENSYNTYASLCWCHHGAGQAGCSEMQWPDQVATPIDPLPAYHGP